MFAYTHTHIHTNTHTHSHTFVYIWPAAELVGQLSTRNSWTTFHPLATSESAADDDVFVVDIVAAVAGASRVVDVNAASAPGFEPLVLFDFVTPGLVFLLRLSTDGQDQRLKLKWVQCQTGNKRV